MTDLQFETKATRIFVGIMSVVCVVLIGVFVWMGFHSGAF